MARTVTVVYRSGKYWIEEGSDGRFTVCDNEGCSSELYHIGDSYDELSVAMMMADFWAGGGHWKDRPDMVEGSYD